jgi:superfamily II DNA helicase RecQ
MADPPAAAVVPQPPKTLEQLFPNSYRNLRRAREAAALETGYDSAQTRDLLRQKFRETHSGHEPKQAQLDVAEALILRLDCTFIAGTGFGKTSNMILPNLVKPTWSMTLIFSPLKALQHEFKQRFEAMGLPTAVLNGETWSKALAQARLAFWRARESALTAVLAAHP